MKSLKALVLSSLLFFSYNSVANDTYPIGTQVKIQRLSKSPVFNGQVGTVEAYDKAENRFYIKIKENPEGPTLPSYFVFIKARNLKLLKAKKKKDGDLRENILFLEESAPYLKPVFKTRSFKKN